MTDYKFLTQMANDLQEIKKINPFLGKLIEKDNSFFGFISLDEIVGKKDSYGIIIDHQMQIPLDPNVYSSYLEMILNEFFNPSIKISLGNDNYAESNYGIEYHA